MGADAARGLAALVPALVFAAADAAARLQLAVWLGLDHDPGARAAAGRAVAYGVAGDLAWLLPVWLLGVLWPGRAARALAAAALVLALLVLAGDTLYFHWTLEHVEPVLFHNVNASSLAGSLDARVLGLGLLGSAAAAALGIAGARALGAAAATPGGRRVAAGALLAALLGALAPATIGARPELPERASERERYLDETRRAYLEDVATPVLANLASAAWRARTSERPQPPPAFEPYTEEERALLAELGLLGDRDPAAPAAPADLRRIVLVVFESLPAAYLHSENPRVPAEATRFLDALAARHPAFERFYTSGMPTDYGMNALLLSRLRPDWAGGRPSLFSVLREARGFDTWYVRGVSKHYGNQLATYPRLFRMDHFLAFEELDARYDTDWHSGWGMSNEVVYAEGLRILKAHRDRRVALVLKTIDLHQPGPFQGIPREHLPAPLRDRDDPLWNALYWVDGRLRNFVAALEREGLLDAHTLLVVTSDHAPHPGVAYRRAVPASEYERLARLPLVLVAGDPKLLRGLDTEGWASQIDVAPTVLDLLGIPAPPSFQGRSLFGERPRFRAGVYGDAFTYASDAGRFRVDLSPGGDASPRARALGKWLRNQDARPQPVAAAVSRRREGAPGAGRRPAGG